MERLIPDAGLVSFPGCGHYSFLDNPYLFGSVLKKLYQQLNIDGHYSILLFLLTLVAGVFALELLVVELKRDLMMLQQNSYRIDRYIKWFACQWRHHSLPRLIAMALFLLSMATFSMDWIVAAAMALFSLVQFIALRRRRYKSPLSLHSGPYAYVPLGVAHIGGSYWQSHYSINGTTYGM